MKHVVVTGVSTGIGWGTVKVLTANGFHVFGSVRKPEDGERLKTEFGDTFTPLLFDVTDEAAVAEGARTVSDALRGATLAGLVNNAGIAIPGPVIETPIEDFRTQIEVNLTGQLIVIQAFAPLLGVDTERTGEPGRIVNISSVGGKMAGPFLGAYSASKHALEGLSEALRRELMLFGVDVIVIGPGSVATPIWDKAEVFDTSGYSNSPFLPAMEKVSAHMVETGRTKGLKPEKIGEAVLTALTAASPKTRYAVVPNYLQDWLLPTTLPKRLTDRIVAGATGLRKS